jgi:hypothetical protein
MTCDNEVFQSLWSISPLNTGFFTESQAVAANWRANSFKSMYRPAQTDETARRITLIAQRFLGECLSPLVTYFFGLVESMAMTRQDFDRLEGLVRMAWDWNSKLKGEVVMPSDFSQVSYNPLSRFDPMSMSEFEPDPKRSPPESILGTIALGLISSRAVGGGRSPETTVVYKAVVVTKSLYD